MPFHARRLGRLHLRLLPLLAPLAALACSSSTSTPEPPAPAPSPAASCADDLPADVAVSEGGLASIPSRGGITYEGVGGVVVSTRGDTTLVRAPYRSAASEPSLRASCGKTIPVSLRPLAWKQLATWTEETGAKAREYGAWWVDPSGSGALYVFGGYHYVPKQFTPANDAWRFDFATSTWTSLSGQGLPTLPGGRVAPVPGARAMLYFGGSLPTSDGHVDARPALHRIDFDDTSMRAAERPSTSAPGSYTGAFVHDAKRSRWLSICGLDNRRGIHCDVTAYTEAGGFADLTIEGDAPSGRFGFHYALDEEQERVVLFGGQNGPANSDLDGETWALELATNPPRWKRLFANGDGPTKRRNGAFAFDPKSHRFFVWGGTPDGRTSVKGIQVLSLDRDAEAWTSLDAPDVPARTSGIAVYDAGRERIVMGFGNSPAPSRDLWSLDLANVNPR